MREDFENFKLLNPDLSGQMPDGISYDDGSIRRFNEFPPMYSFEDLDSKRLKCVVTTVLGMHDNPNYSIRLTAYKKRLEQVKNGIHVMDEEETRKMEEER